MEKDVENWMLETTLPKYADCEKDLNPIRAFENVYFITKGTSFFVFLFVCVCVCVCVCVRARARVCFCMNKLIILSSDNHKGTGLRLGEFQICLFQYPGPLCIMTARRVFAVRMYTKL